MTTNVKKSTMPLFIPRLSGYSYLQPTTPSSPCNDKNLCESSSRHSLVQLGPGVVKKCCHKRNTLKIMKRLIVLAMIPPLVFTILYLMMYIYPFWYTLAWTQDCNGCFARTEHFVINPGHSICSNSPVCGVDMLIMVHSRVGGSERRHALRETWLTVTNDNTHASFRHVFVVGGSDNVTEQRLLEVESEQYGDIVQQNFIDTYTNLTLKNMAGIDWSVKYCSKAKYILKSDEDMYVNATKMLEFTRRHPNIDNYILGRRRISPNSVFRYPPYVEGARYLMPMKIAKHIHYVSVNTPFYPKDDVFVTGMCIWKSPYSVWPFWDIETKVSLRDEIPCDQLSKIYSIHNAGGNAPHRQPHRATPKDLIATWKRCGQTHYYV